MQTDTREQCIRACYACAVACDHCAASCLSEGQANIMSTCIQRDIDCAAFCRMTAAMVARDGPLLGEVSALCAGLCDVCAAECARHDAAHCQACAQACRSCAEACRAMSAA